MTPTFEHRRARVLKFAARGFVAVTCPFCDGEHLHRKDSVGSAEVLAACSTPERPRSYSLT